MKNILCLLLIALLSGCQFENNTATDPSEKVIKPVNSAMVPSGAKVVSQPIKTTRDTTKPTISRSRYAVSRARPKTEIQGIYPYDIELKDAASKTVKSDKILAKSNKPTVLLFWLTTCFPCSMEMKAIKEKYADWQKEADFNFYAISTDFESNFPKFITKVEENKWPWETYNDVNREFRQILPGGLNGLPQTFVLDKNGEIAYHKRKYKPGDEDILFAKVKELAVKDQ